MNADRKDIPEKLRRVLQVGEFRKLNGLVLHTHFGNELVTYGSPSMNLRLVKDREQWSIGLGPADLSGDWYDLEDVVATATGSRQKPSPPDLDSLAEILFENFPKVQKLFENYSSNRSALKRAAASRSGALMKEIFPSFEDGERVENREAKDQRRSISRVKLVEAVQKQLGSQTSKAEAKRAVTAVIHAIKTGVRKDKLVQLVGFGTFKVVERKARKGVNPKTLQQIRIPKSKTVEFVPSKALKSERL